MLKPDPAIDEVREARRRISEKFDHDPARLIDHYIKLQEAYRDRLFKESDPAVPQRSVA
ncbi:MAG: hypothetical protein ACJ8GN_20865 [Longimicrobiaceae bacterium]